VTLRSSLLTKRHTAFDVAPTAGEHISRTLLAAIMTDASRVVVGMHVLFLGETEWVYKQLPDTIKNSKVTVLHKKDLKHNIRKLKPHILTFIVVSPDASLLARNEWHPSWHRFPVFELLPANYPADPVQNCQQWQYRRVNDLLPEIQRCFEFRVKCAQLSQEIEKLDALQRKLRVKGVDALFQHHTRGSLMRVNAADETGSDGGQDDLRTWAWSSGNADNPVSVDGYTQLKRGDLNADVLVAYIPLASVHTAQDVPVTAGTLYVLYNIDMSAAEVASEWNAKRLLGRHDIVDWNVTERGDVADWSVVLPHALQQYFAPHDATSRLTDDDTIEDLSNRVAATVLELQSDSAAAAPATTSTA